MNISELAIIFLVTIVVFGPKKLPMFAHHLGLLMRKLAFYKTQVTIFWQQLLDQQQLAINQQKAQQADLAYKAKTTQINDNE